MSKLTKILLGIWSILAIVCFITCFWLPLFPQIIGIAFGILNILIILSLGINHLQGLYWKKKFEEDELFLQESETANTDSEAETKTEA